MRLLAFSKGSYSWNWVKLRKLSTKIALKKLNLHDNIQRRLATYANSLESLCYFTTLAKQFSHAESDRLLDLPRCCPGCGAFTQITNPDQAGFYGTTRKAVRAFIAWSKNVQRRQVEKEFGLAPGFAHRFSLAKSNNQEG